MSDGLFRSELNSFLKQELAEDGYSGVEVRVTPTRTEIIILATRTQNVLGEKGRRIRELTAVVQKRFNFPEGTVEVCVHCTVVTYIHIYMYMYRYVYICYAQSSDSDHPRISLCEPRIQALQSQSEDFHRPRFVLAQTSDQ